MQLTRLLCSRIKTKMLFPKFLKIAAIASYKTVKNSKGESVLETIIDPAFAQFTAILAQAAGFSYTLYTPKDGNYGRPLPDGNWTGLIGMAQRSEVDLVVGISVTEERSHVVHFGVPFLIDRITFATRKPEYSIDAAAIIKPFSYDVWIAITICLILLPLILYLIEGKTRVFQKSVLYTFCTLLQQPCSQTFKDRLLHTFWLISAMLLGYCYKAILLSYLTIQPFTGVRTIPELAVVIADGTYQCKTYAGAFIIDSLLTSKNPAFQVIGLELQQNDVEPMSPIDFLNNTDSMLKPAFVGLASDFIQFKNSYFISKDTFFSVFLGIALRKDFCCKARLDQLIYYINAGGLYDKLIKDEAFKESLKISYDTSGVNPDANIIRKLSLTHFKASFILLVTGNVLAFIVLLVEILVKKI